MLCMDTLQLLTSSMPENMVTEINAASTHGKVEICNLHQHMKRSMFASRERCMACCSGVRESPDEVSGVHQILPTI